MANKVPVSTLLPSPSRRGRVRRLMDSIRAADRGTAFSLVGDLGKIRYEDRADGRAYFLDFRPYGRVWSHRGIRITDEETARRVLEAIRSKVAEGRPLDEVLAQYLPSSAKPMVLFGLKDPTTQVHGLRSCRPSLLESC